MDPRKSTTGQCKGTLLVNLRAFVVSRGGKPAWDAILAPRSPDDAKVWQENLLVSSWYPVGVWNRAVDAYLATTTVPSAEMKLYATYVSDHDLHTVLKFVLFIATPDLIMARSAMLWARYFNAGAIKPSKMASQHWALAITGPRGENEGPGAVTCSDGVSGWVEQALRLAGAKSPSATHTTCRFRGAPACVSEVTW